MTDLRLRFVCALTFPAAGARQQNPAGFDKGHLIELGRQHNIW